MRARDSSAQDWRLGKVAELSAFGKPLVRVDGWTGRFFSFDTVEVLDAAKAPSLRKPAIGGCSAMRA